MSFGGVSTFSDWKSGSAGVTRSGNRAQITQKPTMTVPTISDGERRAWPEELEAHLADRVAAARSGGHGHRRDTHPDLP